MYYLLEKALDSNETNAASSRLAGNHCGTIVAVLSLMLAVASGSQGDDWPQWRGPQRDGVLLVSSWHILGVDLSSPTKP